MFRQLWATLLVATAGVLHAQPSMPPVERLGDFYRAANRDNPRIAAAQALAQASAARVPGARRPPDPELQLGLMNRSLPGLAPMPVLGMTQLQLMQMIPTAGKLAWAGRAAAREADAAGSRAEDARWEIRSQVAMAYYDLLATDRGIAIARETLGLLGNVAKTAEAMYRVGDGRQADVLRARVEIARMAEDTLRMLAMRETMTARLNALLDRDPSTPVARLTLPRFPEELPARPWLDSIATRLRPMVRAGAQQVLAAEASEALARRELIPDLQVGIQYGQQRAAATPEMGGGGRDQMASLMIGASIPVFARSRQLQMRNEAAAMRQMAVADLTAMRAETRGRVGESFASLQRARRLSALYRIEILPQAEATVASSLSAYRAGSVDFMTLLDNQMSVNRYRQELATLESEQGKAWAELEMLLGRELLDSNSIARHDNGTNTTAPRVVDAPPSQGAR